MTAQEIWQIVSGPILTFGITVLGFLVHRLYKHLDGIDSRERETRVSVTELAKQVDNHRVHAAETFIPADRVTAMEKNIFDSITRLSDKLDRAERRREEQITQMTHLYQRLLEKVGELK